ncbi:MAG: peptidylprolyl isomerase [Haloferacaceae archaeon]
MTITAGDSVTIEYTGRTDDGDVFDTSKESVAVETGLDEDGPDREYEPLTFEVGSGTVIEGLDEALVGHEEGDAPTVTIPPEKAYGEWTDERVQEFDAERLRDELGGEHLTVGAYLQSERGQPGEIVHVDDDVVRVDFNPRLAGETLEFDVEILTVD